MLCETETTANSDVFELAVAQSTAMFLNLLSKNTAICDVFNNMVAKKTAICKAFYIFAQRTQASAMYKNTTKTNVSAQHTNLRTRPCHTPNSPSTWWGTLG